MNEHDLLSPSIYRGFVSVLSLFLAAWAYYDIIKWRRLKGQDRTDPLVQDKLRGYVLGLAMGTVTVIGVLRYNGVV